ncbi:CsiV family protein [Gilvimarinus sp. SDUM040013]|uniref:CsiV family protein n=1 Tax=Gilvimarinus gilvus TaxID=3058038 RepID=A0ABU4S1E7_9GAMM|nr:CsiV family protein [Gilvimarinus sp. SDUM040013]MDO3386387.1 CsiV family protein [Gilvimarinus sp. SDUM040013]MDX6849653.1 CsiV family protein [Gilvimarinus sp. SDUM040013]
MIKTKLGALAAALLTLATTPANSQSSPHEGWYQIEVVIFARPLSSDERWPDDITLDYPLNWEALSDPQADFEQRLEKAQLEAEAIRQDAKLQSLTEQDGSPDTSLVAQNTAPATLTDEATASSDPSTGKVPTNTVTDPGQAIIDAVEPVDLARRERFLLPREERNLNALQQRIDAQTGYRVLFHEAWRQFVTGEKQAPWVLIEGGEAYGEHFELEGSININVSRYLHILTDLWFTEFQINTGQSRRQWPTLPENPYKRLQKNTQRSEANALNTTTVFNDETMFSGSPNAPGDSELDALLSDFLDAPYMPRQIYTLDQRRRMRSTELHYLDHPRLGLLIKILPYDVPPEETETTDSKAPAADASILQ